MKKRWVVLALSFVFLMIAGASSLWFRRIESPPMPQCSAEGGFYQEAFFLELYTTPGNTIYYTTDGSTPTQASKIYDGKIWLCDRSGEENFYHSFQNIVRDWLDYPVDHTPVEKGTVIRAIAVNQWGFESEVLTQTYFVELEPPKNGYVLSLVFEPDDVFGDDGIYVTGREYDQWYLSETQFGSTPTPNFEKSIEVPAIMELMDADGDVINQKIGMRIQGASSRQNHYKRLNLFAREEYSGSNVFDEKLFGVETHSVMLKDSDIDAMVYDFVSDRAVSTQKSEPVAVYLNGEFWYTTYMLERYDSQYYAQYYGAKDVAEVEDTYIEERKKDPVPTYVEFRDWVEQSDCSTEEFWQQLQTRMDVQSYIDYVAINYYFGNIDVQEWRNYRLWRGTATDENDTYRDTRWKWIIYDIDALSWSASKFDGQDVATVNTFATTGTHPSLPLVQSVLCTKLLENPEFRKQFALSLMDMVNNNFTVERAEEILASYGLGMDFMNGYFRKRPGYAPQHLAQLLNLQGTLETVSVTTSDPEAGSVTVNTSKIDLRDGQWEGKYFTDYPITVTAVPNAGYRFVGWKGAADTTEASITVPVDGGIVLEAVFAPLG